MQAPLAGTAIPDDSIILSSQAKIRGLAESTFKPEMSTPDGVALDSPHDEGKLEKLLLRSPEYVKTR